MTTVPITIARMLAAALALALLAGCGKSSAPRPPAGEEASYVYPQVYPAPRTASQEAEEKADCGGPPVLRHLFGTCD